MGAAPSKTSAATASSVLRTRVVRSDLTLAQVLALSRRARPAAHAASTAPVDASGSKAELLEMPRDLRTHVESVDYDRVEFLAETTRAFDATAGGHRPRSSQPLRLPIDRTSAASSTGAGGHDQETVRGRLTARELRAVLRLHYAAPEKWTPDVLAEQYGLERAAVRSILQSVGPPNVLPPRGSSEHPLGVWFDAPAQSS
ncbi:unnamed protein product [Hyaloperonospora brassicae]|uniref:Uncharacterized protein n=1 Tax=Hyaloperonospora brassicae TaxID=162125 RepID=A0AAV0UYE4_HYABA|nr:unnamed protein product [Hyaloperonospora brassicae]